MPIALYTPRGGLVFLQMLGMVCAAVAAVVEIETIVASGPLLTINGLLIAVVGRWRRCGVTVAYGLFAPSAALICLAIIAGLGLSPGMAQRPISCFIVALTVLASLLGALALAANGQPAGATQRRPRQFSIRALLVFTAIVALPLGLNASYGLNGLLAGLTLCYAAITYRCWYQFGRFSHEDSSPPGQST